MRIESRERRRNANNELLIYELELTDDREDFMIAMAKSQRLGALGLGFLLGILLSLAAQQ